MISEEKLRAEFLGSEDLQIEFGDDFGAFFALKKHEAQVEKQDDRRARRRQAKKVIGVDESALRQKFSESRDLQNEFRDVDVFVAYKKAEASGKVKVCDGGMASLAPAPDIEVKKKGFEITESARACMSEAVHRANILADEARQYSGGVPCDAAGLPL